MPQKVVDSNFLKSAELRDYFARSEQNVVVLTDYLMMELYEGAGVHHIGAELAIISDYPKQIVALRNTSFVRRLSGRSGGLRRRMIDVNATRGFADFCKALKQAQTNPYVAAQIEDHKRAAAKHFNVVYDQMAGFNEMLDDIAKAHPPAHLRAFRGGERISREMMSALTRLVAITAKKLYDELWDRRLPQLEEIPNTFIFRYALCMHFAALHALKIGRRANQGKLVNSLVDITLATYATFFDGILSEDKEANLLYSLTSFYLDGLRRVPIEEVRGLLR